MSKIVLEDFNEGDGYYKVNLAYLNKEQVEEIENLIEKWNPTDEDIKSCIGMCLTDANEQRFKDYNTSLKDCLAWLEKQGEQKPNPYSGTSFEYNGHIWGMCARDGGAEVSMDGNLKAFISSDASFIYPDIPQPNLAPKSALEEFKEEKVDNANKVEQKTCKFCKNLQEITASDKCRSKGNIV